MKKIVLLGLALAAIGMSAPASAMPIAKASVISASENVGITQVRYRRYGYSRGYYRPRIVRRYGYGGGYGYPRYGYGGGYRRYGYGGGYPYGGGYGYGGGPRIGFSFGGF